MKSTIALLAVVMILPMQLHGQKSDTQESYGIFQSRDEYHQFMGDLKRVRDPNIKALIPAINDAVLGRPMGWTNERYGLKTGSNTMSMLSNPKVRAELDMVDDQYQKMQDQYGKLQQQMAKQIRDIDFSDSKNALSSLRKITEGAERDIYGVLLPHQKKRLEQLGTQRRMQRGSLAEFLTTNPVAEKLEVTDKQKSALLESEKEIEKELEREIAELRKKAREKLLRNLRSSQRKKFDEMVGDQFDFGKPNKENKKKFIKKKKK